MLTFDRTCPTKASYWHILQAAVCPTSGIPQRKTIITNADTTAGQQEHRLLKKETVNEVVPDEPGDSQVEVPYAVHPRNGHNPFFLNIGQMISALLVDFVTSSLTSGIILTFGAYLIVSPAVPIPLAYRLVAAAALLILVRFHHIPRNENAIRRLSGTVMRSVPDPNSDLGVFDIGESSLFEARTESLPFASSRIEFGGKRSPPSSLQEGNRHGGFGSFAADESPGKLPKLHGR
ncbi:hypothetical protein SeMB42_g05928 [Synchytrium endobioticum]|uniref:Uncharacterized protein n=1 Tax=Synchytrium endobioticum TaxID=286115 RepID=A0A507CNA5_9FUNG|nr:hypothetical protein SeMB42_g05928 [Synchytrium endobioticum]